MLSWAVVFLVVAIIAGLLGFTGIAGTAANIAWILFVIGIILAIVFFVMAEIRVGQPSDSLFFRLHGQSLVPVDDSVFGNHATAPFRLNRPLQVNMRKRKECSL